MMDFNLLAIVEKRLRNRGYNLNFLKLKQFLFLHPMIQIEELHRLFMACQQSICTDTRKISEGSIFFALKGPNFNGNTFALNAIEAGARYAITDEITAEHPQILMVQDVLKTLQDLANYHRKQLKAKILGIGGSNGKTTTKELVSAVLSSQYKIEFTKGNLNNHIGVPLTLLAIKSDCEIAVIELGANHIGDIAELCQIAEPDLGIITNIGKEHLEGFGSIEGVAQAESELYDFLVKNHGHAFVNADDLWLNNMSKRIENKTTYSIHSRAVNYAIKGLHVIPSIAFEYAENKMVSPLMGEHNLQNIAAAIAIGSYFKIETANLAKGIAAYAPTNNRSQIIHTEQGNTILLDAYNANPSSVESAIHTFEKMNDQKQLMLIGDMFELGDHAAQEHLSIAQLCASFSDIETILVGHDFYTTQMAGIQLFENKAAAMDYVKQKAYSHYNVLIKGSRGMKMEDFKDLF
jgi:UDP-N-acetylmuramoyl-tripeptide--D-alanyl-D-alanine ligase